MTGFSEAGTGKVIAVCTSAEKGTQKQKVSSAVLVPDWGIEGDAHAGKWHRQVSLLAFEKIEEFRQKGAEVDFGAFGENLVVEGFDLKDLPVGIRFRVGKALLELTQIGKACHSHCEIYKLMGDCIMPREGVFAEVLEGGEVRPGDEITLVPADPDRPFTAAVTTLSDRSFRGEREDKSGPLISELLKDTAETVRYRCVPDEREQIAAALIEMCDALHSDVVFTTGGTGFSPRDVTPEATKDVIDREAPGVAEAIRAKSMEITPMAMLSRAVSGIRGKTLIINLPGSPKAVRESIEVVLPVLDHAVETLSGVTLSCGKG